MSKTKLAVLDFDGTIYRGDSMREFAHFLNPAKYYFSLLKLLIPYIQFLFGNGDRDDLKELFLKSNFTGITRDQFTLKGRQFYEKNRNRCYPSAISWIEREKSESTQLLILSGSCTPWLLPFSRAFSADLICTQLAFENDICTGEWIGKNMTGITKKEALAAYLQQHPEIDYIIAFGDQKSDAISGVLADEYHENYFH